MNMYNDPSILPGTLPISEIVNSVPKPALHAQIAKGLQDAHCLRSEAFYRALHGLGRALLKTLGTLKGLAGVVLLALASRATDKQDQRNRRR